MVVTASLLPSLSLVRFTVVLSNSPNSITIHPWAWKHTGHWSCDYPFPPFLILALSVHQWCLPEISTTIMCMWVIMSNFDMILTWRFPILPGWTHFQQSYEHTPWTCTPHLWTSDQEQGSSLQMWPVYFMDAVWRPQFPPPGCSWPLDTPGKTSLAVVGN